MYYYYMEFLNLNLHLKSFLQERDKVELVFDIRDSKLSIQGVH
jgi:hypothetical protein